MNEIKDKRYSINDEFCGYPNKRYVLRFEGEFIGSYQTKKDAILNYIFHDDERTFNLLNDSEL